MSDLWRRSASELAAGVQCGDLRAVDVLQSCLERTAAVEPSIGAFLQRFDDAARSAAQDLDRRRAVGESLGALAGVPVAIKDNMNLQGLPTTCASKILEGYESTYTATAVERLVSADAIVVGKTNLDEFSMGSSCENSALQTTSNPWQLDAVPGGSSGGSAAAVASGAVPLALGSDTGGSIRQPAAFCGVVGLKPTYGRVSRYGLVAFASSLDQIGPLARSADDAALGLEIIAGGDPLDATSSDRPVGDYRAQLGGSIEGVRIGIVSELDASSLPEGVAANWHACLDRMTDLGAEVREISLPHLPATIAVYYVLANSEASANLARFDGVRYGHRTDKQVGLTDLYQESREEGFGPEVKRRILLGTFALSSGYYDAYYGRARAVRAALRQQFELGFEEVDVVATPTSPTAAFRKGEKVDDPLAMYLSDIYTAPVNLAGLPAVAVPSGRDSTGLPLSLQIIGRAFDEATVLRVTAALESVTPALGFPMDGAGEADV
ncbi:MAG: Asp-tRNA(Asn)/Glu-tRNA(Gln) amidotransferase subunit GatA [Acidobacteriota bacterium]|nr:Asp-tRNA(Asn)/Glu-tRNA(Gln) amidotransferase subunit GatA [Acidobacteriota bacterium]